MATIYCDSTSGVTEFAQSTAYSLGARVVPNLADTGTNYLVARKYVWECTTAGTTDAAYPTWDASYTPDSSTETAGTAVFTCRNPGYSSGSTVNWTFATPIFGYAVLAATGDGDLICVAHDHSESLTADTTYTFNNNTNVLCVNSGTGALATTALIGAQATTYSIVLAGGYKVYMYGVELKFPGTSSKTMSVGGSDNSNYILENCKLSIYSSGACALVLSSASGNYNSYVKLIGTTLRYGATNQTTDAYWVDFVNCTVDSNGVAPTPFIRNVARCFGTFTGCDFSKITGTLFGNGTSAPSMWIMSNCKLGSGVTIMGAATIATKGTTEVYAFNCSSGDEHYHMYHADAFGSTVVSTTNYVTSDGAAYDGTSKCSWKIVTTDYCTYYMPYVSPWIDAYNVAADGLTLSLEGLFASETDSAANTVARNDDIWGEFSTQATSNSTMATIVSDRMTPLGSDAPQTSALATTDWKIDPANDAYKSTFKLESGIVNQRVIGHIRARVCVGIANKTFYIDPQIRGLS